MHHRSIPALLLALAACDAPDLDSEVVTARFGKEDGPSADPKSPDTDLKQCSEKLYEKSTFYPFGFTFNPGLADLPYHSLYCESLALDGNNDGTVDGQAHCDAHVGGPQGLPAGSTHFVIFGEGEDRQCGCTCGARPACAEPGEYEKFDAVGDGTYAKPYEIWSAAQLEDMAHNLGDSAAEFVQCRDIDLGGFYSAQHPYFRIIFLNGGYDGRGHAITGFTYDAFGPYYTPSTWGTTGLFTLVGGRINNLSLLDARVAVTQDPNTQIGLLAGRMEGADAWKVTVRGEVDVVTPGPINATFAGGLAGEIQGTSLTDITAETSVHGNSVAGGVVGSVSGSILRRIEAAVSVSAEQLAGGIAGGLTASHLDTGHVSGLVYGGLSAGGAVWGLSDARVRRVAADVVVVSQSAGGLAGSMYDSVIEQSRASGSVYGQAHAGGLVWEVYTIAGTSTIRDSFATGKVTSSGVQWSIAGGLVAFLGGASTVTRSYSSGAVQNPSAVVHPSNATGSFIGYSLSSGAVTHSFATGKATGTNPFSFGNFPAPVDPSNRYNSDVNPITPGQGTAASLASGVFSQPNANFGWSWPTGAGGWTFTPGQLPRLTDVP